MTPFGSVALCATPSSARNAASLDTTSCERKNSRSSGHFAASNRARPSRTGPANGSSAAAILGEVRRMQMPTRERQRFERVQQRRHQRRRRIEQRVVVVGHRAPRGSVSVILGGYGSAQQVCFNDRPEAGSRRSHGDAIVARKFDRGVEDVGNILALEHLNLTVPDQATAATVLRFRPRLHARSVRRLRRVQLQQHVGERRRPAVPSAARQSAALPRHDRS